MRALLERAFMTDDPQNNEPSDDDDDQGCDASSQEDEDDRSCDVSSHDDTDDQGCDVSGQISDETPTEYTDEDKTPGVFNPVIISSDDFIPDQDMFCIKTHDDDDHEDDLDDVSYGNDYEEHHKIEIINYEFKSFLQRETKEMTQVVTKYDDRSPMVTHIVPKKRFEFDNFRKKVRVPYKTKKCMAQKNIVNRKSFHHRHINKIKSQLLNCKYCYSKFKKQFFLPKFKFWKFYKKTLDCFFYSY
ncbi:hypothetical protein PYW08_004423 [Mythimna loreyi]|uniref:Uncharacterized protein n=1 Tax=Mythimna loreyi TaxID=667449 RepID=A0ACC2QPF8_9NEOP|nr:hypothetical protein PYW08_004423 [Mythimna loreyi]